MLSVVYPQRQNRVRWRDREIGEKKRSKRVSNDRITYQRHSRIYSSLIRRDLAGDPPHHGLHDGLLHTIVAAASAIGTKGGDNGPVVPANGTVAATPDMDQNQGLGPFVSVTGQTARQATGQCLDLQPAKSWAHSNRAHMGYILQKVVKPEPNWTEFATNLNSMH
jgi:hypothetical protein